MDEQTTLADLLALNLHDFEDDVKNIVDKAVKEMSMEKVLKVRRAGDEIRGEAVFCGWYWAVQARCCAGSSVVTPIQLRSLLNCTDPDWYPT